VEELSVLEVEADGAELLQEAKTTAVPMASVDTNIFILKSFFWFIKRAMVLSRLFKDREKFKQTA